MASPRSGEGGAGEERGGEERGEARDRGRPGPGARRARGTGRPDRVAQGPQALPARSVDAAAAAREPRRSLGGVPDRGRRAPAAPGPPAGGGVGGGARRGRETEGRAPAVGGGAAWVAPGGRG